MGVESPPGFPGTPSWSTGQHGGVRLGCGFRQPNFETKFGASVMVTPPYGGEGRHAGVVVPYEGTGGQVVVSYGWFHLH